MEPLTAQIAGKQVWNQRIDAISFPLVVAVNAGVFTVAGGDGTVLAVQADTGREVWRTSIGSKLGAGVGSDGRFAAVVTRDGELVVLDAGKQVWRKDLGTRVTTAPLVAGERVFVLGVDRTVHAFDVLDGRRLWTFKRPGDPLTLAQTGLITAYKDTLVVGPGQPHGRARPLAWGGALGGGAGHAARHERGRASGRPGGSSGTRRRRPVRPCLPGGCGLRRTPSAATCCGPRTSAAPRPSPPMTSSWSAADATDRLSAWRASNGETAWSNERLKFRGLSSPLMVGKTVVFGDSEGQVHWLSRDKGEPLLRLPTDGSSVAAAPVVSGTTMLVVTRNGGLYAFRPE